MNPFHVGCHPVSPFDVEQKLTHQFRSFLQAAMAIHAEAFKAQRQAQNYAKAAKRALSKMEAMEKD